MVVKKTFFPFRFLENDYVPVRFQRKTIINAWIKLTSLRIIVFLLGSWFYFLNRSHLLTLSTCTQFVQDEICTLKTSNKTRKITKRRLRIFAAIATNIKAVLKIKFTCLGQFYTHFKQSCYMMNVDTSKNNAEFTTLYGKWK